MNLFVKRPATLESYIQNLHCLLKSGRLLGGFFMSVLIQE